MVKGAAALSLLGLLSGANALSDYVKNNVRANMGDHRVLRINFEDINDRVRAVMKEHGVDQYGTQENGVDMKMSPEAVRALEESQVNFEDTTEHWINHFETNYKDPNFFCTDADCHERDMQAFYSSYQTFEAIAARMASLASANPSLASIEQIGTSYEGRAMKVIWIGDQTKPLVFYQCNIHAREWLTPMYCTYMAETLLANGGHALLNTFSFAILPHVNPDGYVYSYTSNSQWRKTRKPNSGSSCVGTDGNRNYGVAHCGEGASTSKCSETYCGVAAFDQPETAATAAFGNAHADRIFSFADIHSYGGYWMNPWGWTYDLPPAADYNRMFECATAAKNAVKATNGLSFITGSSANAIYIAAGGSDDWFYGELGVIYAFSVELRGNSFQPSASNIMPSNMEIFAGMVASLTCAAENEFGATTPAPVTSTTPAPTPTPADCVDLDPNGISYTDGSPAPCNEIAFYCTTYTFVAERCPVTCGTCDQRKSAKELGLLKQETIKGGVSPAVAYVLAPVGAAVLAGLVAAVVVINRQKAAKEAQEVEQNNKVLAAAGDVPAPAATVDVEKPAGKDAPKDMYDV